MTSLQSIIQEIYRDYHTIEASSRTPKKLDELIDEKSDAINSSRHESLRYLRHLQKRVGIGALCAGAVITLAVALPSIPTITLGVVAAVALVILGMFFEASMRVIKFYSDERKIKEFMKINHPKMEINIRLGDDLIDTVLNNMPFA